MTWNRFFNYRFFSVPVLAFHDIIPTQQLLSSQNNNANFSYSIESLNRLLVYLQEKDYWFIDTGEMSDYFLNKSQSIPEQYRDRKPIMLTFDDGYKNIDTYLLPLLQKLEREYRQKIKVVLWVIPQKIIRQQPKDRYLSCNDLQKGTKQGFYDIQSHGFNHVHLTELSPAKLEAELVKSQEFLRQCLQNTPQARTAARHFAYPFDSSNNRVETFTAKYYQSAYKYNSRLRNILLWKNNYTIPRIGIRPQDTVEDLIKLIER